MAIPLIYNVRSVKERMGLTLIVILAIAGVVAVFIAMLSMAEGFQRTLVDSGSMQNAVVLRAGASSEMTSTIPLEQVNIIGNTPGVKRGQGAQPLLAAEVVVIATLPLLSGTEVNVSIRGTSKNALNIRDTIKIANGTFFRAGVAELVIGQNVMKNLQGFNLGNTIQFGGQKWQIVGVMDAGGSVFDSEIWCDADVLNQVYKRPENVFQSVTVQLAAPDRMMEFTNALAHDTRHNLDAKREIEYYSEQSKVFSQVIRVLGFMIAGIMGIGAIFGAINTMYSAITARVKEIATLRAIGFPAKSVITSFLFESLFISFIGGIVGALLILPVQGLTASTINLQTFSNVTFAFSVTPNIMLKGIIFALLMGFVGGLLPAFRASRLPIAEALRGL